MGELRRAPLGALLALWLAGCTTPGAMSNTALDYNETIARASDSQILLNIVRAAYRNPTHYSAISQVRDSRNLQGGASLNGSFPFGPDAAHSYSLSPGLSASGQLAPSFDVAPLDTRSAATGLLHPIESQIPATYWQQDWPKIVLLFMFVDDVRLNDAAKQACNLHFRGNRVDNGAYSVAQFEKIRSVLKCLENALVVNTDSKDTTFMHETQISPDVLVKSLPELDKADIDVTEKSKGVYTVSKTKKTMKFALEFNIGRSGNKLAGFVYSGKVKLPNAAQPAVSIDIRSVDGMVYYLGELVRLQVHEGRLMTYDTPWGPEALFDVKFDQGADPARNITADFLGDRYAISRLPKDGDRSLTVLALLSQLFALYREEKDLPKTSAVEVVGAR